MVGSFLAIMRHPMMNPFRAYLRGAGSRTPYRDLGYPKVSVRRSLLGRRSGQRVAIGQMSQGRCPSTPRLLREKAPGVAELWPLLERAGVSFAAFPERRS